METSEEIKLKKLEDQVWREQNKEKIKKTRAQYYLDHREAEIESSRQYYLNHREEIKRKRKERYYTTGN